MNYYEHHLGDYDGATAHLSWLEDCAYRRLICLYYRNELPINADLVKACRLVRATSKAERDAVQQVLAEFFELQDDGWHHKRCDEELAAYIEKAPDREARKANDRERQQRARERRKGLFDALRERNVVPPFDAKTSELEAMLSRVTKGATSQENPQPVTRDNTATQSPVPSPQTPMNTPRKKRATHLPDGFAISERVRSWAAAKGVNHLDEQLEALVSYARRKGATYVDWDEALMTAIRDDWAKVGGKDKTPDIFAGAL